MLTKAMASRGRRGSVPAHEGEQRRDERDEQQAPAPQGPMLPPPPPVDYGVFIQGLVQAMQTQAHTQAALQAQVEAQQSQERADVWWSSLLRTRFEDGAVEIGGRDGALFGGEEGFSEEAYSSVPEAGEEEGGTLVTAASRCIRQSSGIISTFPQWQGGVSSLWEGAWWFGMLEVGGEVFEVREQRA
ncbi:hypothetical protein Taro_030115 [Colocasia esculenta]|uniref:Uncharacterized protein n=1 Tax=Colocasia esculenta TaxID=4460 RepID=A0A843VKM5_COLES|nr:hypothetical protein [Colocasia esculenta]